MTAAEPVLNYGFRLPDVVFQQAEEDRSKRNSADFAELGERRFVRCVLPVPVSFHDDDFGIGVWVEVAAADFQRIVDVWSVPDEYQKLRCRGTVANAFVCPGDGDRQLLGVDVELQVQNPDERPVVGSSDAAWVEELLRSGWAERDYVALLETLFEPAAANEARRPAYVCQHVFARERAALAVSHFDDGDWSFCCSRCEVDEVKVVHLGHFFDDPTLARCRWLPRGWGADREGEAADWVWSRIPPEDE